MTDVSHPSVSEDDELSPEEEARLMRLYHLGAVAEASVKMESVLRTVFSSLLGPARANVVAAGQLVSWLAKERAGGN